MACAKCGGYAVPPVPEFAVQINGSEDVRLAKVQFRHRVDIIINGNIKDFYSAEVMYLNFSVVQALLTAHPGCLMFLVPSEETAYKADYA